MAAEGVYKRFVNVDLFIDVPAKGPVFLRSVPVLFRCKDPSTDLQPTYQDVANELMRGKYLPPEIRGVSFLREDGSSIENLEMLQNKKLLGSKAVLRLEKGKDLPEPYFTPYFIDRTPRPHAPAICESINGSGTHLSIDVLNTATGLECIVPRKKAIELGLKCLFKDIVDGFDYFGLMKCTVPKETILTGPEPKEALLHVYCSKKKVHKDLAFLDKTVIIGARGCEKLKLNFLTCLGSDPSHVRCQYACCKGWEEGR